jgi:hypothetical protein
MIRIDLRDVKIAQGGVSTCTVGQIECLKRADSRPERDPDCRFPPSRFFKSAGAVSILAADGRLGREAS